MTGLESP